jgi:hypothetical protein
VTSQQAREAEIRAIAGEMVGSLRIVSEGVNPNDKDAEKEFSRLVALANAYHMVWTDLGNCETSR